MRGLVGEPSDMAAYRDLKRYESPDGQHALTVAAGDNGLFCFTLWKWVPALGDGSQWDHAYWSPAIESGLYATAEEADEAAKAEVDWLRH